MSFGDAECIVKMESGVLDGKWRRRYTTDANNNETTPIFASACSSGQIHLHSLENDNNTHSSWSLSHLASSEEASSCTICLSLAWNDCMNVYNDASSSNTTAPNQIVSSHSDGSVALHNVSCSQSGHDNSAGYNIDIGETHRWNAHTMFSCPSEVCT